VVAAGSTLYSELSADQNFAEVLKRIDDLPTGSRIRIRTNCAFIPWAILYSEKYQPDWEDGALPQVEKLWGNRFYIECLQMVSGKPYKPPTNLHEASPVFLSLNLNTTIDDAFAGKAFQPVQSHDTFRSKVLSKISMIETKTHGDEIKKMLHSENYKATFVYFYCHGQNSKPLSEEGVEKLEIDRDNFLEPRFLDDNRPFSCGPIIFLKSCSSGAFSPLSFSTFLTRFREKQALGLITTSFTIPAIFAAVFGQRLIARYLEQTPLGDALRDLCRELLQQSVPLGLFYSLHCPGDILPAKPKGAD
jgi:hypothetical protein